MLFVKYRNLDIAVQGLDNAGMELKFSDVLGDLELGQLTEEYYKDPDLREILVNTALDRDKMASLEGHHLLLVTSVMYSTKFVLQGSRMHQVLRVTQGPSTWLPRMNTLKSGWTHCVYYTNDAGSSKVQEKQKVILEPDYDLMCCVMNTMCPT